MADSKPVDSSAWSDDELITRSMIWSYKIHHPYRIAIGDILKNKFGCDDRRTEIIRQKIVHYGIAKYADNDELDLLVKPDGSDAIESGDPIAYMKKLREDQKPKPSIYAKNSIVGDGNSGSTVGQDFEVFPTAHPIGYPSTNPPTSETKDNSKMSISIAQFIAWLVATLIGGIGIGFSICNSLKH
jgi:hypothetical protein